MAETYGNTTILDELHSSTTVSVERAAQALGISRAYAYTLVKSGDLPVIRLGVRRVRIPSAALLRLLGGAD
jgi:excisionase family DNA binding protein